MIASCSKQDETLCTYSSPLRGIWAVRALSTLGKLHRNHPKYLNIRLLFPWYNQWAVYINACMCISSQFVPVIIIGTYNIYNISLVHHWFCFTKYIIVQYRLCIVHASYVYHACQFWACILSIHYTYPRAAAYYYLYAQNLQNLNVWMNEYKIMLELPRVHWCQVAQLKIYWTAYMYKIS